MSDYLELTKLCCGGNDFIVCDFRKKTLPENTGALVKKLCNRRDSVGADGAIFLLKDEKLPFRISLFNSDGSAAEVSYNGSRCVSLYAVAQGLTPDDFSFASKAGIINASVRSNNVTINVPSPCDWNLDMELELDGAYSKGSYVKAGVPYLIFFVNDLSSQWVESVAAKFKTHPAFPEGTNVAVVKIEENQPAARFFERGVEEETPSSGSGCVAVASLCNLQFAVSSPVAVATAAGEFLITFEKDISGFKNILTAGEVINCFDARVKLEIGD